MDSSKETRSGLCLLKAGRESPHWASVHGLSSVCDAADAASASVALAAAHSSRALPYADARIPPYAPHAGAYLVFF